MPVLGTARQSPGINRRGRVVDSGGPGSSRPNEKFSSHYSGSRDEAKEEKNCNNGAGACMRNGHPKAPGRMTKPTGRTQAGSFVWRWGGEADVHRAAHRGPIQ